MSPEMFYKEGQKMASVPVHTNYSHLDFQLNFGAASTGLY